MCVYVQRTYVRMYYAHPSRGVLRTYYVQKCVRLVRTSARRTRYVVHIVRIYAQNSEAILSYVYEHSTA